MADHITDPRVVAGMMVLSSGDDHVTISGSEGVGFPVWTIEFAVKDGKIYCQQDTGEHLSADAVLTMADLAGL